MNQAKQLAAQQAAAADGRGRRHAAALAGRRWVCGKTRQRRPIGARVVCARPQLSRNPLCGQKREKNSSSSSLCVSWLLLVGRVRGVGCVPRSPSRRRVAHPVRGGLGFWLGPSATPSRALGVGVASSCWVGPGPSAGPSPGSGVRLLVPLSRAPGRLKKVLVSGAAACSRPPSAAGFASPWASLAFGRPVGGSRGFVGPPRWPHNKRLQLTARVRGVRCGHRPPPGPGLGRAVGGRAILGWFAAGGS
jgi:hypothetical protein